MTEWLMGLVTTMLLAANMATAPVPIDFQNLMSADDYPPDSFYKRDEGVSRFAVTISAAGKPTACTITQGAGSEFLDATTCSLLMNRAQFKPAHDEKGNPIVAIYRGNLRWQLPTDDQPPAGSPPPKPPQPTKYDMAVTAKGLPSGTTSAHLALTLIVDEKGKIGKCWTGMSTSLSADVQKAACKQVQAQMKPGAAIIDGKPVKSLQTANVTVAAQ